MNPNASEFIPRSEILTLWEMPFFQQRFERFLESHRILNPLLQDMVLLDTFPTPGQGQKKVIFRALYKNIPLQYEADIWNDPRTGIFTNTP